MKAMAASLDLEKAFDEAWRIGIMLKMLQAGASQVKTVTQDKSLGKTGPLKRG